MIMMDSNELRGGKKQRECRKNAYAKKRQASAKQRVRQQDGTVKWVAPNMELTLFRSVE